MRRSDIYSGTALVLIGLAMIFFIIPAQIATSHNFGLNPRVFPLTAMWLGTSIAALMVFLRLRQPREADNEPGQMQLGNWIFVAAISAFLAASYFAIETLGFLVAAPAVVALPMAAMGEYRHPFRLVLVSALLPLAIYYSFDRLFVIQLP